MKRELNYRRLRTFGEVFNDTFTFLKYHGRSMFTVMVKIAGPGLLVFVALAVLFYYEIQQIIGMAETATTPFSGRGFTVFGIGFLLVILFFFSYLLLHLTVLVFIREKANGEENLTTSRVWTGVKSFILPFILYSFIASSFFGILYVAVLIPIMLFSFIPVLNILVSIAAICAFVFVGVYITFFLHQIVLEDAKIDQLMSSVKKTIRLLRGDWWSTFGIIVIVSFVTSALVYIISGPLYLMLIIPLVTGTGADAAVEEPQFFVSVILAIYGVTLMGSLFLQSIQIIAVSLQYYSLAESKDAEDLMDRIQNFDATPGGGGPQVAGDKEDDERF